MDLVQITEYEYNVKLEIAYATTNNFTGRPLYTNPYCYLHKDAAALLENAVQLAGELGYTIKIFDAYRPLEVQQMLWDDNPDPSFISDPNEGAVPHCRGVAVDLTLLDANGKELDMGTGFDEFSPLSYHGSSKISKQAQLNRYTLIGIMTLAGWDFYKNEWWHYQLFNPRNYNKLKNSQSGTKML